MGGGGPFGEEGPGFGKEIWMRWDLGGPSANGNERKTKPVSGGGDPLIIGVWCQDTEGGSCWNSAPTSTHRRGVKP